MAGKSAGHLPYGSMDMPMHTSTDAATSPWKWITNPIDFLMRLANTLCVPHMVLCIVPIRAPALVALAVAA
jgi:hypothetical protein